MDVFQSHLKETLKAAAKHKGSAFIEILQNCNIFNDGAWQDLTEKDARSEHIIYLEHGKPLIYGKNRDKGIRLKGLELEVVQLGNGTSESDLLVHDETHPRPAYAFMLAHMEHKPGFPTPMGVLRNWADVPPYEQLVTTSDSRDHGKAWQGRTAQAFAHGRYLGSESLKSFENRLTLIQ